MKKNALIKYLFSSILLSLMLLMNIAVKSQCLDYQAYNNAVTAGNTTTNQRVGLVFTASSPIRVTHLGAFDDGGNGLLRNILVGIVRQSDGVTVVSPISMIGSGDPLSNGYRVRAITPVLLPAGQYVVVAVGYGAIEKYYAGSPNTVFNNGGGVLTSNNSSVGGTGFGKPTGVLTVPNLYHAGTFKFSTGNPPTITNCPDDFEGSSDPDVCSKTLAYNVTSPAATSFSFQYLGATTLTGAGTGSPGIFNQGVTNVTVAATNGCGTTYCNFNVTISDLQPPQIDCPEGYTVQCAGDVLAPANDYIEFISPNTVNGHTVQGGTTSDNCGQVTITFVGDVETPGPGLSCSNNKIITRTYKATDEAGNFAYCSQIITVKDNIAPDIQCPPSLTVECAGDVPAQATNYASFVLQGGSAIDNCTGPVTVEFVSDVITPGSCANNKTITRTYKATDACGNFSLCDQTIDVNDQTAPTGTAPTAITGVNSCLPTQTEADGAFNATLAASGYTDNCGGVVTAELVSADITGTMCAWTVTYTFIVKDECGNPTTNQTYTMSGGDKTAPQQTSALPGGNIGSVCLIGAPGAPSGATIASKYTDNCSSVTATLLSTTSSGNNCSWSVTYTYSVKDACNNFVTPNPTVIYTGGDVTAPVLTVPINTSVQCNNVPVNPPLGSGSGSYGGATATDNCSTPTVQYLGETSAAGTCPSNYVLTRTWRATDACGNVTTRSQTITVSDNTAPTLTVPNNTSVQCSSVPMEPAAGSAPGTYGGATATDNCGTPIVEYLAPQQRVNGTCANSYKLIRTWRATDACGNVTTKSQTITVTDNTKPVITCKTNQTRAKTLPCGYTTVGTEFDITATDNCSSGTSPTTPGNLMFQYTLTGATTSALTTGSLGSVVFNVGVTTVTWRVTDQCSNFQTCSFTVTITGTCTSLVATPPPAKETPKEIPVVVVVPAAVTPAPVVPVAPKEVFEVKVFPNPFVTSFSIQVITTSRELIGIRIFDVTGAIKAVSQNVQKGTLIGLGNNLTAGTYFVEVSQGKSKQVVKIIKMN